LTAFVWSIGQLLVSLKLSSAPNLGSEISIHTQVLMPLI